MDLVRNASEPIIDWPAPGKDDVVLIGKIVMLYSYIDFNLRRMIEVLDHASFDRKFAERYWPIFQRKAWGCSATEVEWRKHGFDGSRLGYLLNGAGFFHQAHRAVDDCQALLEILAFELPTTGTSALAVLLEHARKKTVRVWAEQSPFDLRTRCDGEGTVGATEAMVGRDHGMSTSTRAS